MKRMSQWLAGLLVLGLVAAVAGPAPGQGKPKAKVVMPTQTFAGSNADEELQKKAPKNGIITEAKAFTALWNAWKIDAKMPKVDFEKSFVYVATSRGSRLNAPRGAVNDEGDLRVGAISTRDLRPGFRYNIAIFSKEGIKKVNGVLLK